MLGQRLRQQRFGAGSYHNPLFYATENDDSANDDIVADRHLVK